MPLSAPSPGREETGSGSLALAGVCSPPYFPPVGWKGKMGAVLLIHRGRKTDGETGERHTHSQAWRYTEAQKCPKERGQRRVGPPAHASGIHSSSSPDDGPEQPASQPAVLGSQRGLPEAPTPAPPHSPPGGPGPSYQQTILMSSSARRQGTSRIPIGGLGSRTNLA